MSVYDYYEILGCQKDSPYEVIKRAYHTRALKFHPDKNNASEENKAMFQIINEAWKILNDPISRKEYDAACKQEELESQSSLVYARISPTELDESNSKNNILTYRCRCGSDYFIQKEDIQEKNLSVHVPCQECTFVLVVDT